MTNQKLSPAKFTLLGFQHMFAMFGATVLVPTLTGLSVSATLLFAGLGTLLFHLITGGKVPAFLGSSFAFLGGYAAVKAMPQFADGTMNWFPTPAWAWRSPGLIYVVVAGLFKIFGAQKVMRFFPPIVTGPIIICIGMILANSAINNCANNWLIAILAVVIVVAFNIWGKGMFKIIPILLGVVGSYAVAAVTGQVDFTPVKEAAWLGLPFQWKDTAFSLFGGCDGTLLLNCIITVAPIALATMMEHIGDMSAISSTVGKNFIEDPGSAPFSAGRRSGDDDGGALRRSGEHHLRREHRRAGADPRLQPGGCPHGSSAGGYLLLLPEVRGADSLYARGDHRRRVADSLRHDFRGRRAQCG